MDEKQALGLQTLRKQMDAEVTAAHPQFAAKYEAKAAAVGVEAAITPIEGGFCGLCAKVRVILNMVIKPLTLFKPDWAALAKTFMTVVFGTLIPMVCGPQK